MKHIRNLLGSGSLVGDKVVNQANEHIGKIEEIVISLSDGRIAYAVMSFGGFLNFGDKFFAIPWSTLKVDQENKQIILNVDKESLEKAPGFDKSNWPDTMDEAYTTSVNTYFKTNTKENVILK